MNGHEKKRGSGLAAATWSVKVVCPVKSLYDFHFLVCNVNT